MQDFVSRLLSAVIFVALAIAGFVLTLTFMGIAIVALVVLYLVSLFKGKKFSATEYWQRYRHKAQNTKQHMNQHFSPPSYSRRKPQDVSDVDMRDL